MEEKAYHFDNNSQIYNNVRPGYPDEVYEIISKHKAFDNDTNILEIGAGNGIASQEILNKWHPKLTLIEPGNNLCELLYEMFRGINDIIIVNTTFEQYKNETLFDAIFSATAFHWLDLSTKYKKSYDLLKNNGLLVLYWNNYGIEDDGLANDIQKIYTKYGNRASDGKSNYERQMEKIENRRKEVEESGYFKIIEHKIVKKIKEYSTENYIMLLRTFPDHLKMETRFFEEIEEIINENGNKIDVRITINIEIGQKI